MHSRALLIGCDTDQTSELEFFNFLFIHNFLQHLKIMVHCNVLDDPV